MKLHFGVAEGEAQLKERSENRQNPTRSPEHHQYIYSSRMVQQGELKRDSLPAAINVVLLVPNVKRSYRWKNSASDAALKKTTVKSGLRYYSRKMLKRVTLVNANGSYR